MTGDFRNLFVSKGNVYSTVPRGDNIGDRLEGNVRFLQRFFHNLIGQAAMLGSGGSDNRSDNPPVQDHHFSHRGTNINAGKVGCQGCLYCYKSIVIASDQRERGNLSSDIEIASSFHSSQ